MSVTCGPVYYKLLKMKSVNCIILSPYDCCYYVLNSLKTKTDLNCICICSSYRAVNTLPLVYKTSHLMLYMEKSLF